MSTSMNDTYRPQVGDMVREASWTSPAVEVMYVGTNLFVGNDGTYEDCWPLDNDWIKVEPKVPLPDRWVNVWNDGLGASSNSTKEDADLFFHHGHRIAVIHIYTDAEGVDHADIERVQP